MACRPGPLRVGRSLRDVYTAFGVGLPLVGMRISQATNGSCDPKGVHVSRSDRRPRRAPAWQRSSPRKQDQIPRRKRT